MARFDEETSNALFEVLTDWDIQLIHCSHDIFSDDADTDERDDPDVPAAKTKKPGCSP
ncbi:MAG: hypothetical protein RQ847_00765 [Wenzhouxiangellaceae bacterium]|nr:hypothetical protein [Wenzhouxiangellaceae bacterium]